MSSSDLLTTPLAAPDIQFPQSSSVVDVRIIDTTAYGTCSTSLLFSPQLPGFKTFTLPCFAFLVSHRSTGKHVLFDLGMDKNWESSLPPASIEWIKEYMPFTVERNVDEILDEDVGRTGITSKEISSVIWSHHHFDHRGDITKFPDTTEVIVGPGFLKSYTPTYPTNVDSSIRESEFRGRSVRELSHDDFGVKIGGFAAHDFFSDGSFYILSTPGHTIGHISALARVTIAPEPTFIFIGGDCAHHAAAFRPSRYLPLPKTIPAAPGTRYGSLPCPGQLLLDCMPHVHTPTEPFLKENEDFNAEPIEGAKSIASMQVFDCNDNVLVLISHDNTLVGDLDFYPKTLNDWKQQGVQRKLRWRFHGDIDERSAE